MSEDYSIYEPASMGKLESPSGTSEVQTTSAPESVYDFLVCYSSNFLFELWKRVRKYGAFCTGISQNIEDMLQSHVAMAMLGNSEFLVLLNQSASDRAELSRLLNISGTQLNYITNAESGTGLIKSGGNIVPFESRFPTDTKLYKMMTTKLSEQ